MIEAISILKIKLINTITASKLNKAFLQKSYIGKPHQISQSLLFVPANSANQFAPTLQLHRNKTKTEHRSIRA